MTVEIGAPHGGGPHEDERGTSMSLQSEPTASINSEQCLDVAPVPCDAFPAFASVIRHLLLISKKHIASEEEKKEEQYLMLFLYCFDLFMCTVHDHFHGDGLLWGSTLSASYAMVDGGAAMGGQAAKGRHMTSPQLAHITDGSCCAWKWSATSGV